MRIRSCVQAKKSRLSGRLDVSLLRQIKCPNVLSASEQVQSAGDCHAAILPCS